MIAALRAYFISHATIITYMLQSTEYDAWPYLQWYWRTENYATVMRRRKLDKTKRARMLRLLLVIGMVVQLVAGMWFVVTGVHNHYYDFVLFGITLLISYPAVWAHLAVLPLVAAKLFIVQPAQRRAVAESEQLFANHPGVKIAVAGSYGKTTMKEMLATILSEGKKVAATPANKNVAISHAQFVKSLEGDEEVLIIEYGEGAPGDVAGFAATTHPSYAVITGLAPAHLDKYGTLEAAAEDIFSLTTSVPSDRVLVNEESEDVRAYIQPHFLAYSQKGIAGWKVSKVRITRDGTYFTLSHGKTKLDLHTRLLGRHQIGPLAAAVKLGSDLGLSEKELTDGVKNTRPFPHRMQPYDLGGAVIIDDTYNGNLEGIKAGTALLRELDAERKWYVTPGLVDQGREAPSIHRELGGHIAAAHPDIVVLMHNSMTRYIQDGLEAAGWKGELRIESDPLQFYTNLEHFVSHGDVVLMQNDWTDNYH